jgi:hypothetical protein
MPTEPAVGVSTGDMVAMLAVDLATFVHQSNRQNDSTKEVWR